VQSSEQHFTLRIKRFGNTPPPSFKSSARESPKLDRGQECLDVNAARVSFIRERVPSDPVQKIKKLVLVKRAHRRMSRREVVPNTAALIEEKVTFFGNEV
jgi:hypothetical protein